MRTKTDYHLCYNGIIKKRLKKGAFCVLRHIGGVFSGSAVSLLRRDFAVLYSGVFCGGGAAERDRRENMQITFAETNQEYQAFMDKFKPKLTTDDCYTPDNIYKTVREWV